MGTSLSGHGPAPAFDRSDLLRAPLPELMAEAARVRDAAHGDRVTFSPKVFIPLTMLCRDRCGYCTFAKPPARLDSPYLDLDAVLAMARAGRAAGCWEALFTLGEAPRSATPPPGSGWPPTATLDGRLPGGRGRGRAGRDRAAPPRQRRRPVPGRPRATAGRLPVPGHDAGDPGRPPGRARRAAPPGSRQDARAAPGHPGGGR